MPTYLNGTGCVVTQSDWTGDLLCRVPGDACDCLMTRRDERYDTYAPGLTFDGVPIGAGLFVITNEVRAGRVLRTVHPDGWFDVEYLDATVVLMNGERVSVRAFGKDAHAQWRRDQEEAQR